MKESSTYQYVLREGEAKGAVEELRKTLLRLGHKKFGPPSAAIAKDLESMNDLDRLERMADRILEASDWQDLVATS